MVLNMKRIAYIYTPIVFYKGPTVHIYKPAVFYMKAIAHKY